MFYFHFHPQELPQTPKQRTIPLPPIDNDDAVAPTKPTHIEYNVWTKVRAFLLGRGLCSVLMGLTAAKQSGSEGVRRVA